MKKPRRYYWLFLFLGLALAYAIPGYGSNVSVFNFDSDPPGLATTFSNTSNGLTATFYFLDDPGDFVVAPSIFKTLTGNVLRDPGPVNDYNIPLIIQFSANVTSVSLSFATIGNGTFYLLTDAGSASAIGVVPSGYLYPEGTISFSGVGFSRVVLESPDTLYFAIDNVVVNAPEAPSLLLLGTGVLGLAETIRRKLML
jgi:hypothetical protein